jgi:UDP-N-acetylmuramoyl-tripeptide--D-alanyl-D-alanine ligase
MMSLAQAHSLLPGSQMLGDGQLQIHRVHSDTRSLLPGDLFVALRGDNFDGHNYLAQAQAQGAVAALAERGLSAAQAGLQVPDSLLALQRMAAAWRQQFSLPLIAVTGSNGKTTVTQMIAAILRAWVDGADKGAEKSGDKNGGGNNSAALATAGNFNNHIGVPLTLLRLRPQHRAAVLELGMNHPGEIALLAGLAAPTVALVNNAQREHLEFMHSVQAVAEENGAVIAALGASGKVVVPAADAFTPLWRKLAGARQVITFGLGAAADVRAAAVWDSSLSAWQLNLQTPAGPVQTQLHQAGQHNVNNALAAAACAVAAGAPLLAIAQGLAAFVPVAGRSQLLTIQMGGQPVTLIDDSYNANPDSVLAAINVLASLPGPRWLVLGDMGEVGDQGPRFHAEVGARAREAGIDHFWAAGALCAHAGADRHFGDVAALLEALSNDTTHKTHAASVLVKGSRFMRMEQVVQALGLAAASANADAKPSASAAESQHAL